jgi:outer membrane protein assembly factor BamB
VKHLLYLPALLMAFALGGCSSLPDPFGWFESDNQEPPAELTEYEPAIRVTTRWRVNAGSGGEEQYLKLVPALYQGRVLVADQTGRVQSLSAESGEKIWSLETDAPISGGPGVDRDLVLVGTRRGDLIALNENDGQELWRTRLSSEILSVPAIGSGMVVAHTIDGKLFGLRSDDGSQAWTYDRTVPILTLRGSSSPIVYESSVVAGFAGGRLVRLDLRNGDPQWEVQVTPPRGRSELERIVDLDADPVISGDMIYVCTFQGDVAGVSLDTGVVLWRRELSSHAGLTANWRQVYVTDSKDRVWALDPRNGAALWKQEKLLNRRLSAPAILDDYVLVGDLEGYLHWLSYEDGSLLARTRIASAPISAAPRVAEEVAYVYADDGTLAAVTPTALADEP